MTKFEEEVKRPANGPLVELNNNMQEVFSQYRKMREYATQLEDKLEQKDNQFQKLLEQNVDWSQECNNINQINAQLTKENEDLKSQLQQQALPVVPDFVDKFLKSKPIFNIVKYPIPIEIISWANKQTGYMDLEINITYLIKLKTNGYTVEKPQLFYLKNKMTGLYLACDAEGYLEAGRTVAEKFTQSEIDSMQTGSYEQIEVVE